MILGISGKIGCGKTRLWQHIRELVPGTQRRAFGDALKEGAAERFGFPVEWAYSEGGKARRVLVQEGELEKSMTVRELLQWYGTERRAEEPDCWVTAMEHWLLWGSYRPSLPLVIDDVRYPNEAEMVLRYGGTLVRLEPYPGWEPGPYAEHISETALDDYPFDRRFAPRYGELDRVAKAIIWGEA
jgi:hypothetical protein